MTLICLLRTTGTYHNGSCSIPCAMVGFIRDALSRKHARGRRVKTVTSHSKYSVCRCWQGRCGGWALSDRDVDRPMHLQHRSPVRLIFNDI